MPASTQQSNVDDPMDRWTLMDDGVDSDRMPPQMCLDGPLLHIPLALVWINLLALTAPYRRNMRL
jgi:hypothetical protein